MDEPASIASDFLFLDTLFAYQPEILSRDQSDLLVESYVLHVDPFIRLSHKPRMLLELNQFRRGILPDGQEFESELSVIYALGLIPLTAEECILHLGTDKSTLMKSFKHAASHGLARLNMAASHKIRNLRTFLLYIVSCDTLEVSSYDEQILIPIRHFSSGLAKWLKPVAYLVLPFALLKDWASIGMDIYISSLHGE